MGKKICISLLSIMLIFSSLSNISYAKSEGNLENNGVTQGMVEELQKKYRNVGEFLEDNFTNEEIVQIEKEYVEEYGETLDKDELITKANLSFLAVVIAGALSAIVASAVIFSFSSAKTWLINRWEKDGSETSTCGLVKVSGQVFDPQQRSNWVGTGYANSPQRVKALQEYVNRAKIGHFLALDGSFGPKTKSAVLTLQSRLNVTVDGVVGTTTWMKMGGKTNSVCR